MLSPNSLSPCRLPSSCPEHPDFLSGSYVLAPRQVLRSLVVIQPFGVYTTCFQPDTGLLGGVLFTALSMPGTLLAIQQALPSCWREGASELEQADETAFVICSSEGLARMHSWSLLRPLLVVFYSWPER